MIRQGEGTPLVLLHGVLGSETMWQRVVPLLAPHHDTIALTALGHHGGNAATRRPARFEHVIDDAERLLDRLGFAKAHLAGNSMGGWVALELARRGRALSVCALSPAGCWPGGGDGTHASHAVQGLRATIRLTRRGRWTLPVAARIGALRQWIMRLNALHGDRLTAAELVKLADDVLGCAIGEDLLSTDEALGSLDPLPCPVTIAWSAADRVLPLASNGAKAKELVPGARFLVLDDVGHVPMLDAPALVASTILESAGARGQA
jgi:pimeloyl-ACP methyl ester carboxylesterase